MLVAILIFSSSILFLNEDKNQIKINLRSIIFCSLYKKMLEII